MGKLLIWSSVAIVLVAAGFEILLSELLTGWTKQYTSPIYFTPSRSIPDLTGKVAVVTGANTGIGYVTARELAKKGASVIVAARSEVKGLAAVRRIRQEIADADEERSGSAQVQFLRLDLASLASVEAFAKEFKRLKWDLDILVLNAGVMKSPGQMFVGEALTYGFETTQDGFEYHIGVNHIGHAYLTDLLLNDLKTTALKHANNNGDGDGDGEGTRIVFVSSLAESGAPASGMAFEDWVPSTSTSTSTNGTVPSSYEDGVAYGQSKLANLMYANVLADRLDGTGVAVYACHPGIIRTELTRYMEPVLSEGLAAKGRVAQLGGQLVALLFNAALFDAEGGALTQLHLATAPKATLVNGANYHPIGKVVAPAHPMGTNEELKEQLWRETKLAIKKRSNYRFQN